MEDKKAGKASADMLSAIRKLIRMLEPEKKDIILLYTYAIIAGIISLTLPLGVQAIITYLMGSYMSTSLVVLITLVVGGTAFVSLMQIFQLSIVESLQQKIFLRSSLEYSYRIPLLSIVKNANQRFDDLANRFFDTLTLQKDVPKLLMDLSTASLQMLFGLILISFYHPVFAFFSLLLLFFLFLVFRYSAPRGLASSLQESSRKFQIADNIQKSGRAHWWYKAPAPFKKLFESADNIITRYLEARVAHFRVLLGQYQLLMAFKVILIALLLIVGGNLVVQGEINLGQFIASEIVIILIMGSVEKLILSMESIYDVLTAVEKVSVVPESESDRSDGIELDEPLKKITWSSSSLEYGNNSLFKDLNMELDVKQPLAFVIPTSSDRQLFCRFLQGHLECDTGSFKLNSVESSQINLHWWRHQVHKVERTEAGFGDSVADRLGLEMKNLNHERMNIILEEMKINKELALWRCDVFERPEPEWVFNQEPMLWRLGLTRSLFCGPSLILVDVGEIPRSIDMDVWRKLVNDHSTAGIWLMVPEVSDVPQGFKSISLKDSQSIT